jgi:excisionase family DNA binding protein
MSANGMSPSFEIALPPELLEQVAQRAAEIIAEKSGAGPEPWLSVEQAAEHLAVSVSQLYTLCSQRTRNGIPLTKEGSRSYFRASELDAWRTHKGIER